jgi:hypothetical protein
MSVVVCVSVVLIIVCVNYVTSLGSCAGFVKPVNSTYPYGYRVYSTTWTNWNTSYSSVCQKLHPDAQLAMIRDRDAMLLCLSQQAGIFDRSSIALRQFGSGTSATDNWFWADGVPLSGNGTHPRYFEWAPSEPNEANSPRCGKVWSGGNAMADNSCLENTPAFCEVYGMQSLINRLESDSV